MNIAHLLKVISGLVQSEEPFHTWVGLAGEQSTLWTLLSWWIRTLGCTGRKIFHE